MQVMILGVERFKMEKDTYYKAHVVPTVSIKEEDKAGLLPMYYSITEIIYRGFSDLELPASVEIVQGSRRGSKGVPVATIESFSNPKPFKFVQNTGK